MTFVLSAVDEVTISMLITIWQITMIMNDVIQVVGGVTEQGVIILRYINIRRIY